MHTGFYNFSDVGQALIYAPIGNTVEDDCDGSPDQEYEEYAWIFLSGSCYDFAQALRELFSYEVAEVASVIDVKFTHRYCRVERGGIVYYIDIRGITTDEEEFLTRGTNFPPDAYTMEKCRTEDDGCPGKHYDLAKEFINNHRDWYCL